MATCPRCGADAIYLPGDLFSLLVCDFCGDTIDVTELALLEDPAETPASPRDLQVA
jgi:hypothetical protein